MKKEQKEKSKRPNFFLDVSSSSGTSFSRSDSHESPKKRKNSRESSPKTQVSKSLLSSSTQELQFIRWKDIFCIPLTSSHILKSLKIPMVENLDELLSVNYVKAYVVVDAALVDSIKCKTIYYVNENNEKLLADYIVSCPAYTMPLPWCGALKTDIIPTIDVLDSLLTESYVAAYIQVEYKEVKTSYYSNAKCKDVKTIYYVNKNVPECYPLEDISEVVHNEFKTIPFNEITKLSDKTSKLFSHIPTAYSLTSKSMRDIDEVFYRRTFANLALFKDARAKIKDMESQASTDDEFRLNSYRETVSMNKHKEQRLLALESILFFINNAYKKFQITYRVTATDHDLIAEALMNKLDAILSVDINETFVTLIYDMHDTNVEFKKPNQKLYNLNEKMNPIQLHAWLTFQASSSASYLSACEFNLPSKMLNNFIKNYIIQNHDEEYEKVVEVFRSTTQSILMDEYKLSNLCTSNETITINNSLSLYQ